MHRFYFLSSLICGWIFTWHTLVGMSEDSCDILKPILFKCPSGELIGRKLDFTYRSVAHHITHMSAGFDLFCYVLNWEEIIVIELHDFSCPFSVDLMNLSKPSSMVHMIRVQKSARWFEFFSHPSSLNQNTSDRTSMLNHTFVNQENWLYATVVPGSVRGGGRHRFIAAPR